MPTKPQDNQAENRDEQKSAAPEPFFKRYQVKIKASVRAGAVPLGRWPIF
ncbi:MAG TPA: hypothetical protein VKB80_12715 [Kofleriaceae bacterium]|nr:hypothetical protein [Kofleriaceae bacterium]